MASVMRIRLLARALWRHHRRASLVALGVTLVLLAAPFAFVGGSDDAPTDDPVAQPHLILDRLWFDRYPEQARDDVKLWLWSSSGIGVYYQGSAYRYSIDTFDFRRSGRRLDMTFLHDEARARTRFQIAECDEAPFDLCLTLDDSPRGPRRYYSYSNGRAQAPALPWLSDVEARLRAAAR